MNPKRYILVVFLAALAVAVIIGCARTTTTPAGTTTTPTTTTSTTPGTTAITFADLIAQPEKYNGKTVTLEAFYFSGFEISALAELLGPSDSGVWRIVPKGTLIWVESGIPQETYNKLYRQTDPPSGYTERMGKLKVTGQFETGGKYGHLDGYRHQINITSAELLEWSPPPAASPTPTTGNLQVKVVNAAGAPIGGAKVVSEEQPEGQLKVPGLTGGDGIATFNDIKAGNYRFYVNHFQYEETRFEIIAAAGQTTTKTVTLVSAQTPTRSPSPSPSASPAQQPDDIVFTPGGPAYRANVHQVGVPDAWPSIETVEVTIGSSINPAKIRYRANIETGRGQTRHNLLYIALPNVNPSGTNLPALAVTLKPQNLPAGISAVQDEANYGGPLPAAATTRLMNIQIANDVQPGEYKFNIEVILNGVSYGLVPCNIKVLL